MTQNGQTNILDGKRCVKTKVQLIMIIIVNSTLFDRFLQVYFLTWDDQTTINDPKMTSKWPRWPQKVIIGEKSLLRNLIGRFESSFETWSGAPGRVEEPYHIDILEQLQNQWYSHYTMWLDHHQQQ